MKIGIKKILTAMGFSARRREASNRSVLIVHEDCEPSGNAAKNSSAKSISAHSITDQWTCTIAVIFVIINALFNALSGGTLNLTATGAFKKI